MVRAWNDLSRMYPTRFSLHCFRMLLRRRWKRCLEASKMCLQHMMQEAATLGRCVIMG